MKKIKVYGISNCGVIENDTMGILPFFVVENKHGKFLLNWSVMSTEQVEKMSFPAFAEFKQNQLGAISGDWLNKNRLVIVQQVLDGRSGTVVKKIKQILEGTTNGQRILIALDNSGRDFEFYKALGVDFSNVPKEHFCTLEDFGLEVELPFVSFNLQNQ